MLDMIGPGFAPRDGVWAHQGGPAVETWNSTLTRSGMVKFS